MVNIHISFVILESVSVNIDGRRVDLFIREDTAGLFRSTTIKLNFISSGSEPSESEEAVGSNGTRDIIEQFSNEDGPVFNESYGVMLFGDNNMSYTNPKVQNDTEERRDGVVFIKIDGGVFDFSLANICKAMDEGDTGSGNTGVILKGKTIYHSSYWPYNSSRNSK